MIHALENEDEKKQILQLTDLLTNQYIKTLTILNPKDTSITAIYGSISRGGIIMLALTKKKYLKKFRRLEIFTSHYP